jgi:hypothetical protein
MRFVEEIALKTTLKLEKLLEKRRYSSHSYRKSDHIELKDH